MLIIQSSATSSVTQLLHKNKTFLINIPRGATSKIKPLAVVIRKPFKNYVRELFGKHIDENLEAYVEGTLSAAKKQILATKWIADTSD